MLENRSSYECFSLLYPAHQHDLELYLQRNERIATDNPDFMEAFCVEFLSPFVQEQYIRSTEKEEA